MTEAAGSPRRTVLCMKWGTRYPAYYVNRLFGMVRANLTGPFRFVCLTDEPAGIDPGVECRPIPPLPLPAGSQERGWLKLTTFARPLHDLSGPALFLDLDVIVTRPIDSLFEIEGTVLIAHDKRLARRGISNSSVYRFEIGGHADVLEHYCAQPDAVAREYRNEQAYLSSRLRKAGVLQEWPPGWCVSFKYDCLPPWPLNYVCEAAQPPEARIVFFHGHPRPHEALTGYHGLRRFTRPTRWLARHWH